MNRKQEIKETRGKRKISDPKRKNYSKRVAIGDLQVLKEVCPFCGHKKVFKYDTWTKKGYKKCTKCKVVYASVSASKKRKR